MDCLWGLAALGGLGTVQLPPRPAAPGRGGACALDSVDVRPALPCRCRRGCPSRGPRCGPSPPATPAATPFTSWMPPAARPIGAREHRVWGGEGGRGAGRGARGGSSLSLPGAALALALPCSTLLLAAGRLPVGAAPALAARLLPRSAQGAPCAPPVAVPWILRTPHPPAPPRPSSAQAQGGGGVPRDWRQAGGGGRGAQEHGGAGRPPLLLLLPAAAVEQRLGRLAALLLLRLHLRRPERAGRLAGGERVCMCESSGIGPPGPEGRRAPGKAGGARPPSCGAPPWRAPAAGAPSRPGGLLVCGAPRRRAGLAHAPAPLAAGPEILTHCCVGGSAERGRARLGAAAARRSAPVPHDRDPSRWVTLGLHGAHDRWGCGPIHFRIFVCGLLGIAGNCVVLGAPAGRAPPGACVRACGRLLGGRA